MQFSFAIAVLALASAASAAPSRGEPAQTASVPMLFSGTRPAVEVRVNGQGPFFFIVDTGAAGPPARADAALAAKLGLKTTGTAQASDGSGPVVPISEVMISSISLGSLTKRSVEALSRDYGGGEFTPKLDGILGLAFFEDVLLTLDYPGRRISLTKGALPPADGKTILDYELVEGSIVVAANLAGKPIKAIIDTGNIRSVDVPSDWLRPLRFASFPRPAGRSTSVSGTGTVREGALSDPLVVGNHRIDTPLVTFSKDYVDASFGSAFLQHYVVTIDQRNRRIRIAD